MFPTQDKQPALQYNFEKKYIVKWKKISKLVINTL